MLAVSKTPCLVRLMLNYNITNFSKLPPLQLYTKTCIIYKVVHNSILQRQLNVKMGGNFRIKCLSVRIVFLFQEWSNIIDRFLDRLL